MTVISGAASGIGKLVIKKLWERNHTVWAVDQPSKKIGNVQWIDFPSDIANSEEWVSLFRQAASSKPSSIQQLNLINFAGIAQGVDMEKINSRMPFAIQRAMFALKSTVPQLKMIHISSIAGRDDYAAYTEHPYMKVRRETDRLLIDRANQNGIRCIAFQPSFVFYPPRGEEGLIDNMHPWSLEHLAMLPLQPILGSGNQIIQPVSVEDLVDAIAIVTEENSHPNEVIPAVGSEALNLRQALSFFTTLAGRKVRPFTVNIPLARSFVRHFPHGRLAEYAVEMFQLADQHSELNRPLSSAKMEHLLKRDLQKMTEAYTSQKRVILAKPPIIPLLGVVTNNLIRSSEARRSLVEMLIEHGLPVVRELMRAF